LIVIVDWSWGYFWFCAIKKIKKLLACSKHLSVCQPLCQLLAARAAESSIRLVILYLYGWRVYSGLAENDFFSFSFFLDLCACHEKIKSAIQLIFSFDSVPLLLFAFFLFTLVVSKWILFFISSLVIWFFKFVLKFGVHSLNCYLFCFELFYWLIWFFTISSS